jgi:hypothetical protein
MALVCLLAGCGGGGLSLSGVPVATLSVSSLSFVNTAVGTSSAAQAVTISNTGGATLSMNGISLGGTNAGDFAETNTCGSTLAVGTSCAISVTFKPMAAGSFMASLAVADVAGNSPQIVALTGTGAAFSLAPESLSFLTTAIGTTAPSQTMMLTNNEDTALSLGGISLAGVNPAEFAESDNCGSGVAAGASCTITIAFTPQSATSYTAAVAVTDGAGQMQSATLQGLGPEPNSCSATVNGPVGAMPSSNYAGTAFSGTVMAGSMPVVGASVQVYAAGSGGNGSAPAALFAMPLVTNGSGAFSVPASFTCPFSNSVLYAVARGGQVGGVSNAGVVMATVLGRCNSLTGAPAFTINEATTVATAWAMSQFLVPGGSMGATATNSSGIALAAATVANLVNIHTGSGAGVYFPATGTAPTAKINLLADMLNSCTASSGAGSLGCMQLYADTTVAGTAPSNTLDAALTLARNPGMNVAGLYALGTGSTAYAPVPSAAPTDWTLFVNYKGGGMDAPSGVVVDSTGNVWAANYFAVASEFSNTGMAIFPSGVTGNGLSNSFGAAVDASDNVWITNEPGQGSSVSVFNTAGQSIGGYSAGGLNFPIAVAIDGSDTSWVVNYGNSSVTLLSNTGVAISGASGYSGVSKDGNSHLFFPVAVATDALCNGFIANQSSNTVTRVIADGSSYVDFVVGQGPSEVAVDELGNVWSANYYGNSVGLIAPNGAVLSGNGFTGGEALDHPLGIAVDGVGTVWVVNYRRPSTAGNALVELSGAGATKPGSPISPATGWGTDAGMSEAFGVAIDAAGNVWVSSFATNTLTEFVGMAVPVKTPLRGAVQVP